MKQTQKKMIAALVKEGRIAKGYTQKELSDLSHISIRSIQRIENGEILPRSYTLKTLAGILGKSFEDFAVGESSVETVLEYPLLSFSVPGHLSHNLPVFPKLLLNCFYLLPW